MKKIISILFMLALLCTTAFAAGETTYDIDVDNQTVTIKGTASAGDNVLVIVLKPEENSLNQDNVDAVNAATFFSGVRAEVQTLLKRDGSGNLVDASIDNVNFDNYKEHFVFVTADLTNKFEVTLPLTQNPDDTVYLLITSGGSYANDYEAISMYLPSAATVTTAIADFNAALVPDNAVAVANLIDAYDAVFGFNTNNPVYSALRVDIADAMIKMAEADHTVGATLRADYDEAFAYYSRQYDALNEINGATIDTLKTVLETYSSGLNVLGTYGDAKIDIADVYAHHDYYNINRRLAGRTFATMTDFVAAFRTAYSQALDEEQSPGTVVNPVAPEGPSGNISSGSGSTGSSSGGGMSGYVPTTAIPKDESAEGFKDLDEAAWAKESILNLVGRGVVNGMGDGTFNPNGNVTREQFLKMLLLSFGIEPSEEAAAQFEDVDANAWYAPYVNTAYEIGIVNGISSTEFGVGMPITRQDLVTMIMRACDAYGLEISKTQSVSFTDESAISDYAYDAVMDLAAAGVINGVTDGVFAPADNATRAQVSVILDRLYNI